MNKDNFELLIRRLSDELSYNDEEQIKSVTPPPAFDDVNKASEDDDDEKQKGSFSRNTTLKSPSKLKSLLSRKDLPEA